jgi:nucleoside-diphosphate-sugar epimerase
MRTTTAVPRNRAKKRLFRKVKGFVGGRRRLLRTATETLIRAGVYAFRDRRRRRRDMRGLWIIRLSAAVRERARVDDLAAAVVAAIDAPEETVAGELFQVGTGRETTINALAVAVGRAVGRALETHHAPARAGDVRRNVSRVDKAADRLGYRAAVPLEDGLAETAAWFAAALADPALAAVVPHAASGSE